MENLVNILSEKSQDQKPLMVAISGIDGSGKGYIGSQINKFLQEIGINSYLIGIDGWLELSEKRFSETNSAEHFYQNGFRFKEMFSTLVIPLQQTGSIDLIANHADASNSNLYTQYYYQIENA